MTVNPKVLAFVGSGRTGSTVLELLLGQQPGYVAVGELSYLWLKGYHQNALCGERVPVRDSEFWTEVANDVFGGLDRVDGPAINQLRIRSYLKALRVITGTASQDTMRRVREYADILSKTYRAISRISGGDVVLDASKDTRHVCILSHVPDVETQLLHMVRDPRAVVYSWSRPKQRLDTPDEEQYIHQPKTLLSIMKWNAQNLYSELLKRKFPSLRIRYRDFVADIDGTLRQINDFMCVEIETVATEIDMNRVVEQHGIWGNPVRFEKRVAIRPDTRWEHEMPRGSRLATGLLTFPLLMHYGYRF